MSTPEEKLCSRSWRLLHSAFLLWSILSFGLLTFIGFWVIAGKSHKRSWIIAASLWTLFNVATLVLLGSGDSGTKENPSTSVTSTISGSMLFIGWVGGILHSALVRKNWLRWRAQRQPGAWYVQPTSSLGTTAKQGERLTSYQAEGLLRGANQMPGQQTSPTDHSPAGAWSPPSATPRQAGDAPSAPPQQREPAALPPGVDLNTADAAAFVRVGLDPNWAEWLVTTRTRIGRFTSVDDLLTHAQMPPHLFAAVRGQLVVTSGAAPGASLPGRPGAGRRLDL